MIETSGLADPAPVAQAFLSEPTLAGLFRVGSVVAVIDAVNAAATFDNHEESVRQVALADHIVLTKLDLFPAREVADAEASLLARIRAINPAAVITRADDPELDVPALLASAVSTRRQVTPPRSDGSTCPPTSGITMMTITTEMTGTSIITTTSRPSPSSARSRLHAMRCSSCSTPSNRISAPTSFG